MLLAANLGDDADTTAAITGQLTGALYGTASVPSKVIARLHDGDRMAVLARRLLYGVTICSPFVLNIYLRILIMTDSDIIKLIKTHISENNYMMHPGPDLLLDHIIKYIEEGRKSLSVKNYIFDRISYFKKHNSTQAFPGFIEQIISYI